MAPTLRTVVRRALSLKLGVLSGQDALDRPVRWVAVSELEDPTPFLEGGELVLTTGMRLDARNADPTSTGWSAGRSPGSASASGSDTRRSLPRWRTPRRGPGCR